MRKSVTLIGSLILVTFLFVVGSATIPAEAADHLDAPGLTPPGGDGRLDINDVYAFQSPQDDDKTVLILTVNPAAGALSPDTFHPKARYDFLIDTDNDAKQEIRIRARFGKVKKDGQQRVTVTWKKGNKHNQRIARGWTNEIIDDHDVRLFAGLTDDPFFFDLDAFVGANGRSFCDGNEVDFFLNLNVSAIVLEVPSEWLGPDNIGVWARTKLHGKQIDRMGRPAINTVFIPANPFEPNEPSQKDAFNVGKPKNDQADFRPEIVDTLEMFYGAGSADAQAIADILLPDILTVDTSSPAGFLNGRQLPDDVIDAELALVTNNAVTSDCVDNDSAFSGSFPFLAASN